MVLDPIPQSLPVHFFGSRPQPPTSPHVTRMNKSSQKNVFMNTCEHMCDVTELMRAALLCMFDYRVTWHMRSTWVQPYVRCDWFIRDMKDLFGPRTFICARWRVRVTLCCHTYAGESCHMYEWVIWVMSYEWMSHFTHLSHMSHLSHVIRMN